MRHMKKITIRELHEVTGRWVRRASAGEVYVTDRGHVVAKIIPASAMPAKPFFAHPKFTQAFLAQRKYLEQRAGVRGRGRLVHEVDVNLFP